MRFLVSRVKRDMRVFHRVRIDRDHDMKPLWAIVVLRNRALDTW